ncbi:hypothetical protein [Megamonas hypermegale]|uniref:hypothetical protein n=1 Tax=Megamonas hypermegale TaxID=158847 RepID=UPI0019570A28|nr:hypothetical protein [Megamonas hypermegale]
MIKTNDNISICLLKNYKFIQVRMKNIDLEISANERRAEILIPEKDQLEKINSILQQSFKSLTDIEYSIIYKRFVEEYRWKNVADETGYSIRHCQRISNKAIEKMNTMIAANRSKLVKT